MEIAEHLMCAFFKIIIVDVILITPTAPTGYPTIGSVISISSTSVNITWNPVQCAKQNGQILGYGIQYSIGTLTNAFFLSYPESSYYIISGLIPKKVYNFRIAAVNSAGLGPYSPWSQFTVP